MINKPIIGKTYKIRGLSKNMNGKEIVITHVEGFYVYGDVEMEEGLFINCEVYCNELEEIKNGNI